MIFRFGPHLGSSVSALVDGQLDPASAEKAWDHVLRCPGCRAQVERETWVKRKLGTLCGNEPSARLLGTLQRLPAVGAEPESASVDAAWAATDHLEREGRNRRRVGLVAAAGAGGVSMAVLGFAAISTLGVGGAVAPASVRGGTPSPAPTSTVLPVTYMSRLPASPTTPSRIQPATVFTPTVARP